MYNSMAERWPPRPKVVGSSPITCSSGNVQQVLSFKNAFQARGRRFESCPRYKTIIIWRGSSVGRALKINNKRFLFFFLAIIAQKVERLVIPIKRSEARNLLIAQIDKARKVGLRAAIF